MKIQKAKKKELKEIGELMLEELSKPPFNENESLENVLKSLKFYFRNANVYISN